MKKPLVLLLALPLLCGCPADPGAPAGAAKTGAADAATIPDGVFLAQRPDGAQPLAAVKQASKVGDEVVFEAVVGGRSAPFVSKRAIVTVIDTAPKPCPEDEGCKTRWDYCCHTPAELLKLSGTLRLVDAQGKPLAVGLKGKGKLTELSKVVVKGKVVQATEEGVFVIDAAGVWVAP